tara:strand:- start:77 stop:280 length:204 start_codon:yes stop_codon:yes gene_type:complete
MAIDWIYNVLDKLWQLLELAFVIDFVPTCLLISIVCTLSFEEAAVMILSGKWLAAARYSRPNLLVIY